MIAFEEHVARSLSILVDLLLLAALIIMIGWSWRARRRNRSKDF